MNGFSTRFSFLLLPLFFILHVLVEFYHPTLIITAVILLAVFSLVALVVNLFFLVLYKSQTKAAIATLCFSAIYFFFAPLQDFLHHMSIVSYLSKYTILIPLIFCLFLIIVYCLKKTTKDFSSALQYLAFLFCIFIGIDAVILAIKAAKPSISVRDIKGDYKECNACMKPDVYLIIADEYAGSKELKDIFSFANDSFETALSQRGFHVVNDSRSNYNATVYSMASMLNMDYLQHFNDSLVNHQNILASRTLINHNNIGNFFERLGYTTCNYSYFEFNGKPNPVSNSFFPTNTALFLHATLPARFKKDLWFNFMSKEKLAEARRFFLRNNQRVEDSLRMVATLKTTSPKLVYAHFNLPHQPYYFDKNGRELAADSLTDDRLSDTRAYLDNLTYANNLYLQLIDLILKNSTQPPLIILMSDHGFRQFSNSADHSYYFMNLNAVLLPNKNYAEFYDGMSNVNQFRVILNSQFGQRLPMLKDSSIFIKE